MPRSNWSGEKGCFLWTAKGYQAATASQAPPLPVLGNIWDCDPYSTATVLTWELIRLTQRRLFILPWLHPKHMWRTIALNIIQSLREIEKTCYLSLPKDTHLCSTSITQAKTDCTIECVWQSSLPSICLIHSDHQSIQKRKRNIFQVNSFHCDKTSKVS